MLWNHVAYVTAQLQIRREGRTEHVQSQRGTCMAYADISSSGTLSQMKQIMCEHDMTCQREAWRWQRTQGTAHKHMHLSFPVTFRLWSIQHIPLFGKEMPHSFGLSDGLNQRNTPAAHWLLLFFLTYLWRDLQVVRSYLLIHIMNKISLEINWWRSKMYKEAYCISTN